MLITSYHQLSVDKFRIGDFREYDIRGGYLIGGETGNNYYIIPYHDVYSLDYGGINGGIISYIGFKMRGINSGTNWSFDGQNFRIGTYNVT